MILSLSFFNDIWLHSFPEFKILENLEKNNIADIDYLVCDKVFNFCPSMSNSIVDFFDNKKKLKVCERCFSTSQQYAKIGKFKKYRLSNFLLDKDILQINSILQKTNKKNFLDLKIFGVKVGSYALFNFLIENKLSNLNMTNRNFKIYLSDLKDCLMALFAAKKLIDKNKYDYVMAYSTEYSINKVICEYAYLNGVKIRNIYAGKHSVSKYNFLKISSGRNEGHSYHAIKNWNKFKNKSLIEESPKYLIEYVNSFLSSSTFMNYSKALSKIEVNKYFNIKSCYKKIILVALSSMDERVGDFYLDVRESKNKRCFSKKFKNDLDWCKFIIKNSKRFRNYFFIIRPHPRDFSNQRSQKIAEYINFFYNLKKHPPKNVQVDLPDDQLSVYDYIPIVDLLLHSSSSLSFELGLFGIPSLTYDKNLYRYCNDLTFFPSKKKNYFQKLKYLCESKINKKKIIINSFKWLIFQLNYEFISIKKIFNFDKKNKFIIKYFIRPFTYLFKTNYIVIKYFNLISNDNYFSFKVFNNIIKKNLESVFDMTTNNHKFLNIKNLQTITKEYSFIKKTMVNSLLKYPKLKKFYEKNL